VDAWRWTAIGPQWEIGGKLLAVPEREGGLAVSYEARDMAETYRVLELMVLACAGVREILRR